MVGTIAKMQAVMSSTSDVWTSFSPGKFGSFVFFIVSNVFE
jgi:hypothetical protein